MSAFPQTQVERDAERHRRKREDELALLLLAFLWDEDALAYFTRNGRRVPQRVVRAAVNAVVDGVGEEVAALGSQVAARDIGVDEWRDGVARRLKTLHVTTAAAASGGFENMSPAVVAQLEGRLRFHLVKLNGFADDVANGFTTVRSEQMNSETGEVQIVTRLVPMTASRIISRSGMYVAAAASDGYEGTRGTIAVLNGYKFERNVLTPAEHCQGCLDQTARGWVPIGQLVPIGRRTCLSRCRCQMQFARESPN